MFGFQLNKLSKNEQKKESFLLFDYSNKIKTSVENLEFDFNGLWVDVEQLKSSFNSIDRLILANWKCCFLNCSYCYEQKTDDLNTVEHFDIFPVVQQLIDSGLVKKETQICFSCGDATLHPEFDKLMYFLINYGMKDIVVHTSAMRFCQSIADAMISNIIKITISLDSGCPYIYEKIKGINKYDIAVANIKRYLEFEDKSSKKVILNYVLCNGVNDNKKEVLDWFMFSRNLGVKKLSIDIDEKWYNEVKNSVPYYLSELIMFVKELSDINNFEIEFTSKIESLI